MAYHKHDIRFGRVLAIMVALTTLSPLANARDGGASGPPSGANDESIARQVSEDNSAPSARAQPATTLATFRHDAFTIEVPSGWKTTVEPEPGVEIGFIDEDSTGAKWLLHYEVMPEQAGDPPTDAKTQRAILNQWDSLVRQEFPGAKRLAPQERKLPGLQLMHALYELEDNGIPLVREYVYLFSHRTAYVIDAIIPKDALAAATPGIDKLFNTFQPSSGAKMPTLPITEVVERLNTQLPKLAISMPPTWRPTITGVRLVEADSPGGATILIPLQWPRKGLKEEFAVAKKTLALLQDGQEPTTDDALTMTSIMYHAGQLLGLAAGEVAKSDQPIAHFVVSVADSAGNTVGSIRIRRQDLNSILSGREADPVKAARLYELE